MPLRPAFVFLDFKVILSFNCLNKMKKTKKLFYACSLLFFLKYCRNFTVQFFKRKKKQELDIFFFF